MAVSVDDAILEGFICPSCMITFGTSDHLSHHFQEEHQLCDLPLEQYNSKSLRVNLTVNSHAFYEQKNGPQPLGLHRSHTQEFISFRKTFINRNSLETNNLIIRLEKLLETINVPECGRKVYEQTIVPWIDTKVNLCPSCGKHFGLGAESMFPDDSPSVDDKTYPGNSEKVLSKYWITKKISNVADAILDYNPVYRRRHHCRLCGHVLCADCSHFLSISDSQKFLNALNVHLELSRSNVSQQSKPSFESNSPEETMKLNKQMTEYALRICSVCKSLLDRKFMRMQNFSCDSPLIQMHKDLKEQMMKVTNSLPIYTNIAESLNSGEQRYTLDLARSMHSELLQALQKIESLGRQFEKYTESSTDCTTTPSRNRASMRLARTISKLAKNFVQINLPPMSTLPTLKQYDNLTAQRKDELAVRWREEDEALAQLTRRLSDVNARSSITATSTNSKIWHKIFQQPKRIDNCDNENYSIQKLNDLAIRIDYISQKLMKSLNSGQLKEANIYNTELNRLEQTFQNLSFQINNNNSNNPGDMIT